MIVTKPEYVALGLMSGTSLDGLDIALCRFMEKDGRWDFEIRDATTLPYNEEWRHKLASSRSLSGQDLALLDLEYGHFLGIKTREFVKSKNVTIDLIGSHGHTVFHQPDRGLTLQIGNGAQIAAQTGILTVNNFRVQDVALGGQGAPLVPIGDRDLFSEYTYCLNIGGFANISFEEIQRRVAFDVCPANLLLNHFARRIGHPHDPNGSIGATGSLDQDLLKRLNELPYYSETKPKSLGIEWVEQHVIPLVDHYAPTAQDALRTLCEHIAMQIAGTIKRADSTVLVTGGGAYNRYLLSRLKAHAKCRIIIPDKQIIEYKEALIFAFLGVLRMLRRNNVLASVTGARCDHCSGQVFLAPPVP